MTSCKNNFSIKYICIYVAQKRGRFNIDNLKLNVNTVLTHIAIDRYMYPATTVSLFYLLPPNLTNTHTHTHTHTHSHVKHQALLVLSTVETWVTMAWCTRSSRRPQTTLSIVSPASRFQEVKGRKSCLRACCPMPPSMR